MVTSRSYKQRCGIARALDLVGERWALLVVRELVLGPRRFTDLREGLPGIATNVLTQRLQQLEGNGIVTRRRLPPPAASNVYELTEYGRELVPIMLELGRWGARSIGHETPEHKTQGRWFAVALQAFFDADAAADLTANVALDFGDTQVTLRLNEGRLEVVPGLADDAELTIAAEPETLVAYLSGAEVSFVAEGDGELLARLRDVFPFRAPSATVAQL